MAQLLLFILVCWCCTHSVTSQMPMVIQSPQNQSICEGRTVYFECVITFSEGTSPGGAFWSDGDGNPVEEQPPTITIDDDSNGLTAPANVTTTLTIANVSISDNETVYFCGRGIGQNSIASDPSILIVLAPPMTAPYITGTTPLSSTSFTVNWTITDPSYNYTITWINLHTGMMEGSITVPGNTNSYTVTGLNGIDNCNVSVTANNSCGMMMSDPITVYDPPTAPMNIRFPPDGITNESFVIQWDAVNDFFTVNYTVRWYRGDNEIGMASVDEPSYTVAGLTANTSYNVTVSTVNTCCGTGPVSNVVMIMTNNEPPTLPPSTTTTATLTPTPVLQSCTITSPSANNIRVSCESLERISVTISSNSCTCSQPITIVDNNPITVSDLPIGVYTVEVTAVNGNDMSIENNRIVEMITIFDKSTAFDESDSSSLSTGAAVAIGCVITLLVSITVTAIVTAVIMYMLMKRKYESTPQDNTNKVLYEEVTSSSHTTSKNDVELQQNPAYGTGSKVVMDTNPAYESYK